MPVCSKRGALLERYTKKQPVWTSQAPLLTPIPATSLGFQTLLTQLIGSISAIVHSNSAPNFLRCDDEQFCFSHGSSTRSFGPRSYKNAGSGFSQLLALRPRSCPGAKKVLRHCPSLRIHRRTIYGNQGANHVPKGDGRCYLHGVSHTACLVDGQPSCPAQAFCRGNRGKERGGARRIRGLASGPNAVVLGTFRSASRSASGTSNAETVYRSRPTTSTSTGDAADARGTFSDRICAPPQTAD